jgi:arsenite-transporting ATPase
LWRSTSPPALRRPTSPGWWATSSQAPAAGSTRLILYIGKGGVGKTTIAASTAARAAALGHHTLVVSTDVAHSLGDVFGVGLEAEPREIGSHLYAQEINVLEEARRSWGKVQSHMSELLRREGVSEVQADELAILPGMDEIAALTQIGRTVRSGEFDCIVVDAAPTGETIRLLSMPESLQWYAGRIDDWRGRLTRFAGPIVRGLLPDLNVVDIMQQLATRIRELRMVLTDAQRSSYRIVVTPDRMVLKEAQRAETYLNLFEYPIDAVVLNRLMPPIEVPDRFMQSMLERQRRLAEDVRRAFPTLPVFEAPYLVEEPIGRDVLADLGAHIFGAQDPTAVLHVGPTQEILREGEGYLLRIPMPNVEVERLGLIKRGDELYVDVGNVRREIALPAALAALEPATASVRGGMLEIPFVPGQGDATNEA